MAFLLFSKVFRTTYISFILGNVRKFTKGWENMNNIIMKYGKL
jgi:hypothetical protein